MLTDAKPMKLLITLFALCLTFLTNAQFLNFEIPDDLVTSIRVDDNIYGVHADSGFVEYNIYTGDKTWYTASNSPLRNVKVRTIVEDEYQTIWIQLNLFSDTIYSYKKGVFKKWTTKDLGLTDDKNFYVIDFFDHLGLTFYVDSTVITRRFGINGVFATYTDPMYCYYFDKMIYSGDSLVLRDNSVGWFTIKPNYVNFYEVNQILWDDMANFENGKILSVRDGVFVSVGSDFIKYNQNKTSEFSSVIERDKKNNVWINERDVINNNVIYEGFSRFTGTGFTDNYQTSNSDLPNDNIIDIRADIYGNIVLTHGSGVTLFNQTGVLGLKQEIGIDSKISLYPNPSNGMLNISFSDDNGKPMSIEIRDITGKMILSSANIASNTKTLDLSYLQSGTYLISVFQENKMVGVKKWVKTM
ncbi:MAG: hypothetical protein ACI9XP_001134 [Lentimonas sp.]